jgi:hypothetical protein
MYIHPELGLRLAQSKIEEARSRARHGSALRSATLDRQASGVAAGRRRNDGRRRCWRPSVDRAPGGEAWVQAPRGQRRAELPLAGPRQLPVGRSWGRGARSDRNDPSSPMPLTKRITAATSRLRPPRGTSPPPHVRRQAISGSWGRVFRSKCVPRARSHPRCHPAVHVPGPTRVRVGGDCHGVGSTWSDWGW